MTDTQNGTQRAETLIRGRAYLCVVCRDEIPSVATHVVTEWGQVLCASCAENPADHSRLYTACPVAGHTILDHPAIIGTSLSAHRAQMRICRAQEVASG